jgi:hypothetical protein
MRSPASPLGNNPVVQLVVPALALPARKAIAIMAARRLVVRVQIRTQICMLPHVFIAVPQFSGGQSVHNDCRKREKSYYSMAT